MTTGSEEPSAMGKDDIILKVALPIILLALVGMAIRFCIISSRRHASIWERRQSIRALERAQVRENKRLAAERKKKRHKEIDDALICKVASKCKCAKQNRRKSAGLDITMRTNATDDMSVASASSTSDNRETDDLTDGSDDALNKPSSEYTTCAICLEHYSPGKDKVSWSKYQTCNHAFHLKCIEEWLAEVDRDGSCPCCRGPYLKVVAASDKGDTGDAVDTMNAEISSSDDDQVLDIESNAEIDIDKTEVSHLANKKVGLDFVSFCVTHGLISIKA
mmetsp:Transcript_10455/g.14972  ORF Transcript_10455/g.14972 Transcript_10455/m.14972 type:complete len:277 (+) Transcript_10455:107-937(+)|eukprot:CAMPEP_0201713058 /NCGR_PEP_ID=MMETSP0578-20130828/59958_1 /ASSEMBLY_ACC=CAM_ASM_000663 /TAXON_ID=267565 /ORGANISM="Skeletonema grethea, Strain CCMP 1804" /LENGTH=276 /DNA_ID=CAMNT_0048202125 /DNA_START=88 /DNA_END=918 /DNA_ORIENTATION=+